MACSRGQRFIKIPHPLRGVLDDAERECIHPQICQSDEPREEESSRSASLLVGSISCRSKKIAFLDGGAIAERRRGRYLYFLLFCRVKREAENPFEIENARIHLFPKIPTSRTERRLTVSANIDRLCRKRRSLNARWIPDAQPGDF